MIRVGALKKGIKNGKWKEFNKHGVLIAEGLYINDKKHGVWREYYDFTGTIMIEENYENGIPHGRYASFHPNGQLLSEGNFLMGLRAGYFRIYDEHGTHTQNLFFDNDIQVESKREINLSLSVESETSGSTVQ